MKKLLVLMPLILLVCALSAKAQEEPEPEEVTLPDSVMEEVVRRVVTLHFISTKRSGVIYFADRGIKAEWLPKMENIEFVVLTDGEREGDEKEIHFIKKVTLSDGIYDVWFGYGDPDCTATGDVWQFQITDGDVVQLLTTRGGWGSGWLAGAWADGGPVSLLLFLYPWNRSYFDAPGGS